MPTVEHPPFWLVWNPSGFAPRFRHQTRASAQAEAVRLAGTNPGTEFFVLQPVVVAKKVAVEVRTFCSEEISF